MTINGAGATICGWTEMKVQPAVSDMASASVRVASPAYLRAARDIAQKRGAVRQKCGRQEHPVAPHDLEVSGHLGIHPPLAIDREKRDQDLGVYVMEPHEMNREKPEKKQHACREDEPERDQHARIGIHQCSVTP